VRAQSLILSPRGIPWGNPQQADPFVHPPEVRVLHHRVEAQQEAFILAWYEHFGRESHN
jgi:hypothetical protein